MSKVATVPTEEARHLCVPREDGSLFASPDFAATVELTESNHERLADESCDIQGRSLRDLREWTRESVCDAACRYTSELRGTESVDTTTHRLVVAGHQPTLFHPGVWVKNFALARLAERAGGAGLNLVVDNDTFSTTSIRVPAGTRETPTIRQIPFDAERRPQPWEGARIRDPELFRRFGSRIVEAMSCWNTVPLATEFWPKAVEAMSRSTCLVDCLTAARNRQECAWGSSNLELPISRLCGLDSFLWFVSHLLAHLSRFRAIHNRRLEQYRLVNKVRSHTHPVPDLKETDGWLEAPFWIWQPNANERRHVFARQERGEVLLSDGSDVVTRLPLSSDTDATGAVDVLRELPKKGILLRTRALTTTLFARLCLADLFVHGIGGAKYDELTDQIISEFFGIDSPAFLTLSATLHLPEPMPHDVSAADERRLRATLRDLQFNSQRHLTSGRDTQADALVAEKKTLIREQQKSHTSGLSRRERRLRSRTNYVRYRRFRELSNRLAEYTTDRRRAVDCELTTVRAQLRANGILKDRSYAFCLYPAEKLRSFLTSSTSIRGKT